MIVGFTVLDYRGHEEEAIKFIRKHVILRSPVIARNIVERGPGINIYTRTITAELLNEQPFLAQLIELDKEHRMVISAVDFHVEILLPEGSLKLSPTEYVKIPYDDAAKYQKYVDTNHICMVPAYVKKGNGYWILRNSVWDDGGIWIDTETWND